MVDKSFISSLLVALAAVVVLTGTSVTAQDWDGGDATNNDDGGNDNGQTDTQSTDDTSTDSDSWDGGDATNNDDGDGTWDGGDAENNDDGTSTSDTWDGEDAENNDDGDGTDWDGGDAENNDDGDDTEDTDDSDDSETDDSENEDSNSGVGGDGDGEITSANVTVLEPKIDVQIPDTARSGETVEISGEVQYPRNRDITIMVDGQTVQQTSLDDNYRFSTQFTAGSAGEHTVTVETAEATVERTLYVTSNVDVTSIDAPERVDSGRNVNICGDVESAGSPTVKLVVDGTTVAEQTGTGRRCFTTDMSQGTHTVTIEAEIEGDADSETSIVTVSESSQETVSRDVSDSPQSSAGIFQSMIQMLSAMVNFMTAMVPA